MRTWKGNGNTTTLLFFLKGLEILHQEEEDKWTSHSDGTFNSILFYQLGSAYKQHTYQSINQSINQLKIYLKVTKSFIPIFHVSLPNLIRKASVPSHGINYITCLLLLLSVIIFIFIF